MKKIILLLTLFSIFVLSACDLYFEEDQIDEVNVELYDYSDFESISINSHAEAEGKSDEKYIVYYYRVNCLFCKKIKQDILSFAQDFTAVDFYIFDTSGAADYSIYEEFIGTPSLFVMSGGKIIESYVGSDNVLNFINLYTDIQFDYNLFSSQHLLEYSEVTAITSERYLVYYYLETCPNCIAIKNDVLSWAFTKNVDEVFFLNAANVTDPDNIPTELQILSSGTPLLIVMNNGVFTQEYYLGKDDILDYVSADSN